MKKITIIAELCQNHNGDKKILEEMISAASSAGADYAKIQTINSEDLNYRQRFEDGLIEGGIVKTIKRPFKKEKDRLSKLDLNDEDYLWFIDKCKKYKIKSTTTIFNRAKLKFLESLDFDFLKVASFDCASFQMMKELANSRYDNFIISTGATYDSEIKRTSEIFKSAKKNYSLLHCISIYPTPIKLANLNRLDFLKQYSDKVGISDHSIYDKDGPKLIAGAIFKGAEIVEKHFTILPKDQTKDGIVSANEKELKEIVDIAKLEQKELKDYIENNVPEYQTMLGDRNRELSHEEILNRDYYQGRFISRVKNGIIYNWESTPIE